MGRGYHPEAMGRGCDWLWLNQPIKYFVYSLALNARTIPEYDARRLTVAVVGSSLPFQSHDTTIMVAFVQLRCEAERDGPRDRIMLIRRR